MDYSFLLTLAAILLITKGFGLISRKIHMPQVIGALVAGILLGPMCFNVLSGTELIDGLAELGVILLMFTAGMETDIKELMKAKIAALIIAAIGVLVPLISGFVLARFFGQQILESIFIGVILTATSVTITVETLQEMGKLKTNTGTAILGAAVIDDIIGVIILSIIMGVNNSSGDVAVAFSITVLKILIFILFTAFVGLLAYKLFEFEIKRVGHKRRISIFAFAYCLILAYCAELFGVADITGAYFAGLILCNNGAAKYIEEKTEVVSYLLLSPIFFTSIGLKAVPVPIESYIVLFTLALLSVAVLSKVIGCGLGAFFCKYNKREALQIGVGMISRGEVALIVANKGISSGLLEPSLFSAVVIVVIITTLITPLMLKRVYADKQAVQQQ